MSAKIFPVETYARSRKPLDSAPINYIQPAAVATPPPKQPESKPPTNNQQKSPLSRTTTKTLPPSPPKVISDVDNSNTYSRVRFLGEGGFARVYEMIDASTRTRVACKVISKASLKTKKAKTKLFAEIKIHGMLDHANIVRFYHCFQDDTNVYMTLSLCDNGSLMDFLRRRRYFSEPEARFYLLQLISACHYMHTRHSVIHRDLKLGNLFLDSDMNLQVGDFGLAALIEREGERKKTICGTPNYIAPEVLFDTANGHSFEVDTWSIGVILYTLVVGRPPFQTKEVKEIYKRIQQNHYTFPSPTFPSPYAQSLIGFILTPDPTQRPSLYEVVQDPWFLKAPMPRSIPPEAFNSEPDFSAIGRRESARNLREVKAELGLDRLDEELEEAQSPIEGEAPISGLPVLAAALEDEEKQFAKAVQPGSPISVLLTEARKPLTRSPAKAPPVFGTKSQESHNAYRRLVKTKPAASPLKEMVLADVDQEAVAAQQDQEQQNPKLRKELESQKARIVFQMVRGEELPGQEGVKEREAFLRVEQPGQQRDMHETNPRLGASTKSTMKRSLARGIENQIPGGPIQIPTSVAGLTEGVQFGPGMLRRTGEGKKLGVQPHHTQSPTKPKSSMGPPAAPVVPAAPPKDQRVRPGSVQSLLGVPPARRHGMSTLSSDTATSSNPSGGTLPGLRPATALPPPMTTEPANGRRERVPSSHSEKPDVASSTSKRAAFSGKVQNAEFLKPGTLVTSTSKGTAPSTTLGKDNNFEYLKPGTLTAASVEPNSMINLGKGKSIECPTYISKCPPSILPTGATGFVAAAQVQWTAWDDKKKGRLMRDPRNNAKSSAGRWHDVIEEDVYIVSWVDFCHKYGMGYALTDGTIGVHFNDSTTLLLSADQVHFDFIEPLTTGDACGDSEYRRHCFTIDKCPDDLQPKLYLAKHFENYIMDRLWGEHSFCFTRTKQEIEELSRCAHIPPTTWTPHHHGYHKGAKPEGRGMEWVMNYLRMKHAIVFRLSHDVLQFNFHDHSKVILSQASLRVTYIDKKYQRSSWTLEEVLRASMGMDVHRVLNDHQRRQLARVTEKLSYCKEVLMSIYKASTLASSSKDKGSTSGGLSAMGIQKQF